MVCNNTIHSMDLKFCPGSGTSKYMYYEMVPPSRNRGHQVDRGPPIILENLFLIFQSILTIKQNVKLTSTRLFQLLNLTN
jgi:hypothetical protein